MAAISLHAVRMAYPNGHLAVRDVSLEIADGELLVLVGPSGSGKSTVLRLIAGLEAPSGGAIRIDSHDVTRVPPQQRDLAMVFQNYALYPHKSVRENMAFGLRVRGMAAPAIDERVRAVAESLGLETLLDRRPAELSGGQRQRVALGRAIVREPRAFLLDEPLSNLDPLLRADTRAELALLHRRLRTTMVYVTHDQEEAMTLGTRIAVMNEGRIEQVASPLETFAQPATAFVARFIGSPTINLWPATWAYTDGLFHVTTPVFTLDLDPEASGVTRTPPSAQIRLGVRPHDVALVSPGAGDLDAEVQVVEALGAQTTVHARVVRAPDQRVRLSMAGAEPPRVGARVGVRLRRDRLHLFDEATGRRLE
jgi:multiple sugar transport system ATP-binding protein